MICRHVLATAVQNALPLSEIEAKWPESLTADAETHSRGTPTMVVIGIPRSGGLAAIGGVLILMSNCHPLELISRISPTTALSDQ